MSVNKQKPHVVVVPEDDADRQLVVGFQRHFAVNDGVIDPRKPAGGWLSAMEVFEKEMVPYLRRYGQSYVALIVDFDQKERRSFLEKRMPQDLRPRVFLLGLADEPEATRKEFGISLEQIGWNLAEDCRKGTFEVWGNSHFANNREEVERMIATIKPFVFHGA